MSRFAEILRAIAMYTVAYGASYFVAYILGRVIIRESIFASVPIMNQDTMHIA